MRTRIRLRRLFLSLSLLAALLMASRRAQAGSSWDKIATTPVRDGFTMGATIGRGSIEVQCATCPDAKISEALSVSGHAGYMVTPQLSIVGEHWMLRFNERGSKFFDDSEIHLVAQQMTTIATQLFVTNRVWIKGGIGFGWHITDGDYDASPAATEGLPNKHQPAPKEMSEGKILGTATFVAVGVELAHNEVFAVDLQLRGGTTRRPDGRYQVYNTGLNVGFNWY